MAAEFSIAFIGGGNMAEALVRGLATKQNLPVHLHVVDNNADSHVRWKARGASVSLTPSSALTRCRVWIYAVKPQHMRAAVEASRPWLQQDTLVISVAAGIPTTTLARWLGSDDAPWECLVRCMPNTPALIGAGITGLAALPGVNAEDRKLATQLLGSVGQVVWVNDDPALDAVTAVSGSGPAYVFLFLESLIAAAQKAGLSAEQARQLTLATFTGATRLAELSEESLTTLRERVTSKGGTTAAALQVFSEANFPAIVEQAVLAAVRRARELGEEFG
jgi:pyrroline-5-carboxylate reductase